jgi:2-polyprenyl-3-methyl-5-hydroxy-6-metoxy-1,4-benzoquinol methylase
MNDYSRRPCPACKNTIGDFRGSKNGFDIFVCSGCKTIYTSRLPVGDETEDYDNYYTDANLVVPDFISQRVREIIGGFSRYRKTNRLLDIGFGAGTILTEAKNQNWDAYGTEVSQPAVDQAKKMGHRVHHGLLKSATFTDGFFDVIIASEILEHLPEPEEELREISRILRPGGLFWATTPSAGSLSFILMKNHWSVLSPPEHTQLYSKRGARLMLTQAGFSNIQTKTTGLNPSEIINYYRPRSNNDSAFDRVGAGYDLNEKMTKGPVRRTLKAFLNSALNLFQMGDSLKILAEKPPSEERNH